MLNGAPPRLRFSQRFRLASPALSNLAPFGEGRWHGICGVGFAMRCSTGLRPACAPPRESALQLPHHRPSPRCLGWWRLALRLCFARLRWVGWRGGLGRRFGLRFARPSVGCWRVRDAGAVRVGVGGRGRFRRILESAAEVSAGAFPAPQRHSHVLSRKNRQNPPQRDGGRGGGAGRH